jgi:tRNA modification GTPase
MSGIQLVDDTIIALATPQGVSGLAVIRLSGKDSIKITDQVFKGKRLVDQPTHTVHLGTIGEPDKIIDEVLVTVFKEPNSFTKENSTEISCHGSPVIIRQIIKLFLKQGVRLAEPGEFTKRAFMNGRFDLAQAEAVADLIHAENDNTRPGRIESNAGWFLE